jgi:hypothetical protein
LGGGNFTITLPSHKYLPKLKRRKGNHKKGRKGEEEREKRGKFAGRKRGEKMEKREKEYWERLFGELSKYSFIVVFLAGVALLVTSRGRMLECVLMITIGGMFTIVFGLLGSMFAKKRSDE